MSTLPPVLVSTARAQCGALGTAQLRAGGCDYGGISYRLATGSLERVLPGAYVIAGTPKSWERDLWSALLWAGVGSAASFRAAARQWGVNGFSGAPIEVSTVNHKRCAGLELRDGTPVVVHRVDDYLLPEIVVVEGIPTTSLRRTFVDLAGKKDPRTESVLDAAVKRDPEMVGHTWLLLEQMWMRGRRGVRIGRDLLIPRTGGQAPTDSDLELMLRRAMDRAGLPAPVHQHPMTLPSGRIRIDLAYPAACLAIEADSLLWHLDRRAFESDRRRDNELRALGWTVFRFTWAMIRYEPDEVTALIRAHLARRVCV